jgi:hypothetical protein
MESLFTLYFRDHRYEKNTIKAVKHLVNSPTLRALDFSFNNLAEDAIEVAKLFATSTTLRVLNLNACNIGRHAVKVAEALRESTSLCAIGMPDNDLTDIAQTEVRKIFSKPHSVKLTADAFKHVFLDIQQPPNEILGLIDDYVYGHIDITLSGEFCIEPKLSGGDVLSGDDLI